MPSRFLPDVLRGDRGRRGAQGDPSVVPGPPGPPGLAQWQLIFDVTFSMLGPQVFADGIQSLGGTDFEVLRTADATSSSGIVAGGLKLPSASLSTKSAYKADACVVQVPNFSSVVPAGIPFRSVFVIDHLAGPTQLNSGYVVHGLYNPTQIGTITPETETIAINGLSTPVFSAQAAIFARHAANNTRATFDAGVISGCNRGGFLLPTGYCLGLTDRRMLQGTSVDDPSVISPWPTFQGNYGANSYDIGDGVRSRSNFNRDDMTLYIAYHSTDQTATCYAVISRWRLEAFYYSP